MHCCLKATFKFNSLQHRRSSKTKWERERERERERESRSGPISVDMLMTCVWLHEWGCLLTSGTLVVEELRADFSLRLSVCACVCARLLWRTPTGGAGPSPDPFLHRESQPQRRNSLEKGFMLSAWAQGPWDSVYIQHTCRPVSVCVCVCVCVFWLMLLSPDSLSCWRKTCFTRVEHEHTEIRKDLFLRREKWRLFSQGCVSIPLKFWL